MPINSLTLSWATYLLAFIHLQQQNVPMFVFLIPSFILCWKYVWKYLFKKLYYLPLSHHFLYRRNHPLLSAVAALLQTWVCADPLENCSGQWSFAYRNWAQAHGHDCYCSLRDGVTEGPRHHSLWSTAPHHLCDAGQRLNLRQVESFSPAAREEGQEQETGAAPVTATHQMLIQSSC